MGGKAYEPDGPEVVNVRQYYSDPCDPLQKRWAGPADESAGNGRSMNGRRPRDSVVCD
jgi:hypothetical protein